MSDDDDEVSLMQLWGVVRRRKWLVAAVAALCTLASGFVVAVTVPVYQGRATVRIDQQSNSMPVLDALQKLGSGGTQEFTTEMEVLRSRSLAETVVAQLQTQLRARTPYRMGGAPFFIEAPRTVPVSTFAEGLVIAPAAAPARWRVQQRGDLFAFERRVTDSLIAAPRRVTGRAGNSISLGDISFRLVAAHPQVRDFDLELQGFESAVSLARGNLRVSRSQRDANIAAVSYDSHDAALARDVPNALVAAFLELRNRGLKTAARSTVEFLRSQLAQLQDQLNASEERLRAFREQAQTVHLESEATAQVSALARLRADRDAKEGERAALARLLAEAAQGVLSPAADTISPYRALVAFPTLLSSPAATFLTSLNTLENERAVVRQTRTASAADVRGITGRIRALEEQLKSITVTYVQGLGSQVAALDSSIVRYQTMVQRVPAREMEFARLEREAQLLGSLYSLLQTRLKEAEIAQAIEDSRARVVDPALLPAGPIKPRPRQIVLFGLLLGLAAGFALAFAKESLDRAIHTREEMAAVTGAPSLGLIPHIGTRGLDEGVPLYLRLLPSVSGRSQREVLPAVTVKGEPWNCGAVLEAYRALRTNLAFAKPDDPPRCIVVTSPFPRDGKSTTAANLAVVLAQQGRKVLLVDGDMRRGTLHQFFNDMPRTPGLSSLLIGEETLERCVATVQLLDGSTIYFVPSGPLPPNPSELFGASRMDSLLVEMRAAYDMVLFDAPPLNMVTDAAVLGVKADGVLLVGRAGQTDRAALAFAAEQLRHVRAYVLGTVLNDFEPKHGYGDSYGYGYGYGYGYDTDYSTVLERSDGERVGVS